VTVRLADPALGLTLTAGLCAATLSSAASAVLETETAACPAVKPMEAAPATGLRDSEMLTVALLAVTPTLAAAATGLTFEAAAFAVIVTLAVVALADCDVLTVALFAVTAIEGVPALGETFGELS
jgi:hypothetical protein